MYVVGWLRFSTLTEKETYHMISLICEIEKNNTNTWRLNNTLLNNQEITEEIKEEIKKYIQTNENENTMTQNLCGLRQKRFQEGSL